MSDARSTADLIAERGYRVVGTCTAREAAELRVRLDVLEETVGKLVAHVALLEEKGERRPAPLERIAFE